MPRYYRRRYTRVVKPKKKWATNLVNIDPYITNLNNTSLMTFELCKNASPISTPTPVILKTGNFKVQCDSFFNVSQNSVVEFSAYIVYLPEGITIGSFADATSFIERHPEWIMCWKFSTYDYISGGSNIDTVKVSSRLKRNLNSGDKIMFLGLARAGNAASTFIEIGLKGMCQYWTCAN